MNHQAFGQTDIGRKRDHNEDAILLDDELGVYIVCDGLGGHAAGDVASQLACTTMQRVLREQRKVLAAYAGNPDARNRNAAIQLVERAVDCACREVYAAAQADRSKRGMATTVVLMAVLGHFAIIAHVGDSRIYLVRRGQAYQLTDDHSLLSEQVRLGLLTAKQVEAAQGKSAITRAVGFQDSVPVETLHFELMPGDTYLLCSDGLCDYMHQGDEFRELCDTTPVEELPDALRDRADLKALIRWLESADRIRSVADGLWIPTAELDAAAERIRAELAGRTGLGPADFREVLPVTRRHLIPLLNYFDGVGTTRRGPDGARDVPEGG